MDEAQPPGSAGDNRTIPKRLTPGQMDGDDGNITFRRSHLYAALIPLAFVVGLSVGFLFWGRNAGASTVAQAADRGQEAPPGAASNVQSDPANPAADDSGQASQADVAEVRRYDVPVDDDPQLGPDDAPITIIEFSDFECPFCQKFHVEVFQRLLDEYQGQIRFVYRDFPLASIHSNAIPAAEASNCAFEQAAYWEYHDLLFGMTNGLSREAYLAYAQDLNLDMAEFETCVDSRRYQDEVQADYEFAARLGVRSTPTFFINGLPLVGAQPFEVFQQVIEKELAGEIP